jgi:exosortase
VEMTPRTQIAAFAFLCGVSIVLWWHALVSTLRLALSEEAYTHILLIVPLSLALIYLKGRTSTRKFESGVTAGAFLLAAALLIAGFARWGSPALGADLRLSLRMFAMVVWWVASVVLCFGVGTFRRFLFPLCFLFWVVPVPAVVLNWIIPVLQKESASTTRVLFQIAGVPVAQDGTLLNIRGLTLYVAPECSSIRSSLVLIMTTMVLAHLFLRSWWRKSLITAIAVPLAVAKNGLRIFVIAKLGTGVDRGFFDGNLHHHGGIVFFGIAVVVVVALIWFLHRWEVRRPTELRARLS